MAKALESGFFNYARVHPLVMLLNSLGYGRDFPGPPQLRDSEAASLY
jgi:hypothetical protein